ncbi:MAG: tRNA guanosine(34) transglycosylase Tgt [Candidatus Binatus sp.]|uniref:tRNA guanosine(34) transglycosylase Tgt n=1 Tax=Candidatus Binatus sp. TaxID=2811406 RepID=UPI002723E564|nr:tRNA guanosine(34) transglycosylase Tgt [Candidatus Binatus sp.]MDO8432883.1 tRNA guanosine(34) transglycosylase Tgt [Candidatus Binatus sp.]
MQSPIEFSVIARDDGARAGRLVTGHGEVATPAFMPVGTRAAVKAMAPDELWDMGYRMVLANAYHLAIRPGAELVREMGGVASFMGYRGAVLTDSGGFQAMSLAQINSITDDGIRFRSHLDGSLLMLTPESAVEIQQHLGADIMMALDECTPYPCEHGRALKSLDLTARWAERSHAARISTTQALFGIVQGSVYPDLRKMSAAQITSIAFDGYAVGGLSVGEPKPAMLEMAALSVSMLPADKPRYLMGVGTPADLLAAIAMGFDMFDCVLPTRNARNGSAFTSEGRISIKQAVHARDGRPLDPACDCRPCRTHSRAYLRHLFMSGEILAARALTEHNLHFYANLMRGAQAAIASRTFAAYAKDVAAGWPVKEAAEGA